MEELISIYCRCRGINSNLPNWNFFLALSYFKMAGIAQVINFLICVSLLLTDVLLKIFLVLGGVTFFLVFWPCSHLACGILIP